MKITEIHRTANGAWSPASHNTAMFALGTSAHQVDSTFSTTASLEIFEFNPATQETDEAPRRGVTSIDQRIFKLAWTPHISVQGQTTNAGALVAGVEGGIAIYSVDSILHGKDDVVIRQVQSHSGPVKALDVSVLLPNFLASGAGESEVFFWDLNVAGHSAPSGPKSYPLDDVSSVAWNKKIGYILASSFANRCVLWDLRKNDAIIKLQDQNSRIRYKAVEWNPEIATQLALASDDDHSPVVQIWDLRNASSPVKTLEGHNRGILSLAWCPHDSAILLSAGKDGCVYGWNVQEDAQPEIIFSLPPSKGWPFELSWSPRIPSVFALSSYDNSVGIYTVMGGRDIAQISPQSPSKLSESFPGVDNSAFQDHANASGLSESIRKAPKWLRRPGAFSFSLDGKIVKTATENGVFGLELGLVTSDGRLVERAGILEQFLNYNQPLELCENKIQAASKPEDRDEWRFIKTFFEEDQHQGLKNIFGFDQDQENKEPSNAAVEYRNGENDSHISDPDHTQGAGAVGPFKIRKGSGVEAAITQSLLLGNIEAAVEMCLAHGLNSEALFLSLSGCGPALPELYHKVREEYFASHGSALSSLIYGIVKTDARFIIDNCDVTNWREVVILFANHFPHDHFKLLTGQLGDRLEAAKSSDAIFCHILSGNVERAVNLWTTRLARDNQDAEKRIEEAVEKVFVLCIGVHGNRPFEFGPNAIRLMSAYAAHLAGQGGVAIALRLISRFSSNGLAPWKQILYSALGPSAAAREAHIRQPPMPQFGKISPVRLAERKKSFPSGAFGGEYNNGLNSFSSAIDSRAPLGVRKSLSHMDATTVPRPIGGHGYNPAYPLSTPPATISSYAPPPQMPLPLPQGNTVAYPGTFSNPGPPMTAYPAPPLSTGVYPSGPASMNSALQPQLMGSSVPQQGFYDPTTHSTTVKPQVDLDSHLTSFQHKKLTSGWNDPPPLSALTPRRSSNASVVSAGAITQPFPQFGTPAPPVFQPGNVYPPAPEAMGLFSNHQTNFSQPVAGFSAPLSFYSQNFDSVSSTANETSFSAPSATPPPPKEKEPIPADLMPLSEGFASSLARTHQSASASGDTHSIRKLDDVGKKLELLKDCLRSGKLSAATLSGLSHILQCMQAGDYGSALSVHANLSSQISFLEVGSFLPAIKVLIQLAQRYP